MDENTRFLVDRMDEQKREILDEIKSLKEELTGLRLFKERVLGMSAGISVVASFFMQKISKII